MRPLVAAAALLVALLTGTGAVADGPRAPGALRAVGPIGITVADLDRSLDFYARILGFEKVDETEGWGEPYERLTGVFGARVRVARMRLGDETIELVEYLTPRGRPVPADSRSHDRWFQHVAIIVSDMDRAYAWLRVHRVEHASPAPQRLPDGNPVAGGIRAFYFKDPDGHPLEILWFPPGKGDARWQRATGRLFLGIDHTAIVVADTDRSLACYRDALGRRVAGESLNHGPEQERLNNVHGARLRITTLRAGAGPGVELLEYLAPRDGRSIPEDLRANDLVHWRTGLVAVDAEALHRSLRGGACVAESAPAPTAPGLPGGFLLRDPDGHRLQVVAP